MKNREFIVPIFIKAGNVLQNPQKEDSLIADAPLFAASCENFGADAFLIFDLSETDEEHDQSIRLIKQIDRSTDLPLYGGGNIRRLEDVKKLIYAGCKKVFLNFSKESNIDLAGEASARFGRERMLACVKTEEELTAAAAHAQLLGGAVLLDQALLEKAAGTGNVFEGATLYCRLDAFEIDAAAGILADSAAGGIFCESFSGRDFSFMDAKHALLQKGIPTNVFASSLDWSEIKTGCDGLLPVVVQDYRTLEVLMVAYMNEEAYRTTIRTGRMTYWSRSRKELWVKGLTSGHFQYVKELTIDCDNDTLLAKVAQIGAACHTGHKSCFYRPILQKEYDSANPQKVFEEVLSVIEDRKAHPKEGSYTNYLFNKGIDKILKKVGEEASEIIIAAKNPDPEEVTYEISDFLYHVMVLMCELGLTWEDITEELAKR
ncbi:MAG: bifunctional phosphoribosyl-AMP cyclohydrolase/phosphoribosyl-ATP diphosphatase HisIE [Lachnospiraceae bacterium]|nr:bifunctional phosphoribosyl-AMP cyclohydrolase/phosphoribosyl-ATP diphosphatase HisIE [Lachnospiraceae bacterium]